jgi:hypothetical protein
MTGQFRYTFGSLVGDYVRAFAGIVLSTIPLLAVSAGPIVNGILGILILLFSIFAARTVLRHASVIETTAKDIASVGVFEQRLAWEKITAVHLNYFSTWRDKSKGWMQLKVKGSTGTLRIDSDLSGFDVVAATVAECTARNDMVVNDVTIGNFAAMGISVGGSGGSAAKLGDVGG